jgi:hypothetical protein
MLSCSFKLFLCAYERHKECIDTARCRLNVFPFRIEFIHGLHRLFVPVGRRLATPTHLPKGSTHIVNTIPPLSTSRASLGTAPDQNVITPSFLKMDAAHAKLFL